MTDPSYVFVRCEMTLHLSATVRLPHLWPDGAPTGLTPDQLADAVRESMATDDRTDLAFHDALAEDALRLLSIAPVDAYDVSRIAAAAPNPAHGQSDGLPGIDPPPEMVLIEWTEDGA